MAAVGAVGNGTILKMVPCTRKPRYTPYIAVVYLGSSPVDELMIRVVIETPELSAIMLTILVPDSCGWQEVVDFGGGQESSMNSSTSDAGQSLRFCSTTSQNSVETAQETALH